MLSFYILENLLNLTELKEQVAVGQWSDSANGVQFTGNEQIHEKKRKKNHSSERISHANAHESTN